MGRLWNKRSVQWESSSLACLGLEGSVLPKEKSFQLVKEPFLCLKEKWESKDSSESGAMPLISAGCRLKREPELEASLG